MYIDVMPKRASLFALAEHGNAPTMRSLSSPSVVARMGLDPAPRLMGANNTAQGNALGILTILRAFHHNRCQAFSLAKPLSLCLN
jgi:hypothetical protein